MEGTPAPQWALMTRDRILSRDATTSFLASLAGAFRGGDAQAPLNLGGANLLICGDSTWVSTSDRAPREVGRGTVARHSRSAK